LAGLLYYLPTEDAAHPGHVKIARVRKLGLGYALDRCTASGCQKGPDGDSGVIVADSRRVAKIGHYPDRQTWRRIPGLEAWVGYYTDDRPTPEDLQRDEMLDGHLVKLADRQAYVAPIARGWSDDEENPGWFHAVPQLQTVDENGDWVAGDVVPRYQRLWQIATRWWDVKTGALADASEDDADTDEAAEVSFSFATLNDDAVEALATNYHLGKAEVGLLGLFDTHAAASILDASIDWPTWVAQMKKKLTDQAPESLSTDAGPPVEAGATGQP
jgi:hypothetical protein